MCSATVAVNNCESMGALSFGSISMFTITDQLILQHSAWLPLLKYRLRMIKRRKEERKVMLHPDGSAHIIAKGTLVSCDSFYDHMQAQNKLHQRVGCVCVKLFHFFDVAMQ